MSKFLTSLCAAITALSLVSPVQAATAKSKKTATAHTKQVAGKTAKKKTTSAAQRKQISRNAIANARKSVHVTRAIAEPVSLAHPGVSSSAALVMNERSGEILYQKNPDEISSIASITKLMTAMVVLDAQLPLNELLTIGQEDVDTLKNTSSRLVVGTTLTRG